jgi:hypothetical protein
MNKKRTITLILLLAICFCLLPYRVQAASTADAVEPFSPEKPCNLTLTYCYDQVPFAGIPVKIYKIAQFSVDLQFTLTAKFQASGLDLNGIRTAGEWNVIRSTLEAYIIANGIEPDFSASSDQNGQISFDTTEAGLYLAIVGQATQNELHCSFASTILSLPDLGDGGRWDYAVSAAAKAEILPPTEPDSKIEMKVIKLWRGMTADLTVPRVLR